jgi:LDH2 family malate/lactate/ureidoglycolate dehydrogenase
MAGSSTPLIGPADDAVVVTEVYLEAALWGRKTHGFRLIPWTLEQMKGRKIGEIKVDQETPVSALLDGGDRKAVSMGR